MDIASTNQADHLLKLDAWSEEQISIRKPCTRSSEDGHLPDGLLFDHLDKRMAETGERVVEVIFHQDMRPWWTGILCLLVCASSRRRNGPLRWRRRVNFAFSSPGRLVEDIVGSSSETSSPRRFDLSLEVTQQPVLDAPCLFIEVRLTEAAGAEAAKLLAESSK